MPNSINSNHSLLPVISTPTEENDNYYLIAILNQNMPDICYLRAECKHSSLYVFLSLMDIFCLWSDIFRLHKFFHYRLRCETVIFVRITKYILPSDSFK